MKKTKFNSRKTLEHHFKMFITNLPLDNRNYFKEWWKRLCEDIDSEFIEGFVKEKPIKKIKYYLFNLNCSFCEENYKKMVKKKNVKEN